MLSDDQIARAQAVNIGDVASERGFKFDRKGNHAGPCPRCGGNDRFSISIRKGAFWCRQCQPKGCGGAINFVMFVDDVGFREAVETLTGERDIPVKSRAVPAAAKNTVEYERQQHDKARWLWSQRRPINGTIAETYLRDGRKLTCPLPPTLAFLPPRKREHHPAMIAAFGLCDEIEPGIIAAPREVIAVHLTLLKLDGSDKAEVDPNKLTLGSAPGVPIVLAPTNDLLGLVITEGIEEALSVHQALGLGAWAAGSAGRMPPLAEAVPDYCDCVTVVADGDKTGTDNAEQLARRLNARGIHAEVVPLAEVLG